MDIKDLSQLYYLNREIEKKSEDLKQLQVLRWGHSATMTGMPKSRDRKSHIEQIEADIEDLTEIIKAKQIECIHERNRLARFINSIPDSEVRMIFEYRFADCLSWDRVAASMGEGHTAEQVRQVCSRYIRQQED